jgi:glutathione synthase/RimK-type ligase-like ATP-grasp enzyme
MAAKISTGFGQAVCGFDIVRMGRKSFVIDVNGWTSVKNQSAFYDEAVGVLSQMLLQT